ncbi:MAG: hypothetical protein GY846_08855 [Deltaproteobacteria bacterium]|nr:hypothetical protein [Deltaproteobacteria bacterium]
MKKSTTALMMFGLLTFLAGCGSDTNNTDTRLQAQGSVEVTDNIMSTSIVSNDDNVLKAEYEAGFLQGGLQKEYIISSRDNYWDDTYLTDPAHFFPKQEPPSRSELDLTGDILIMNYNYTLNYIKGEQDPTISLNMKRLIFRMLGIYHGTVMRDPALLDFSGSWLPELSGFEASELKTNYETDYVTFMDIYFLNAYCDVMDVINFSHLSMLAKYKRTRCSAFVKKTADDIFITHNSWSGFLTQTTVMNYYIKDMFISQNAYSQGLIASNTDFGYTGNGLMYNETTAYARYTEPKIEALWMFMRSALAENFASTIDEFFGYMSLEASGTYCNGYMVVDIKTGEIGMVEMSYKNFVFFKTGPDNTIEVTTKPEGIDKGYDTDMVQPDYLLGINYPASYQIRKDLDAIDSRPARKRQFLQMIGGVNDIESAKDLITYTDPEDPLSIYGRWDLGYGDTPVPKTVPDGSVDAKAISANMARYAMNLQGKFDTSSTNRSFWMKSGTPSVNGLPFIWSLSQWSGQKLRNVPDVCDGDFNYLNTNIK